MLEGVQDFVGQVRAALADRYAIEREIGRGGMALVFLARDLKHNRNVALKVLRPELNVGAQVDRFQQEIQITAGIRHPNVLPLYDSGIAGGHFYYVMPFVEGETLRTRLNREGKLPLEETVRLAQSVAAALAHAHGKGLVHRDVKPENILLEGEDVLLADFGIARAGRVVPGQSGPSGTTDSRVVVGTPGYMSPEQASGIVDVGPESDVYSLACVVCEMLGAKAPFTGSTPERVLKAISDGAPATGIRLSNQVTTGVGNVLKQALEQEPKQRYQTVGEFSFELRKAADRRPHPWRVAATVAAAVVGIIVVRQMVLAPRLDPTRYVLAPMIDSPQTDSLQYRRWQSKWENVLRRVPDIKLEESTRVADQVLRRGRPTNLSEILAISRAIGAGRLVVLGTGPGGDSTEIRAQLYDVGSAEPVSRAQVAVPLGGMEFGSLARLAENLFGLPNGAISVPGNVSDAAAQEFAAGRQALDGWKLREAEGHLRRATTIDPAYADAHFWLAQAKAWAGDSAPEWTGAARNAVTLEARLTDARDRARARALLAIAERRFPLACGIYDSLVKVDPLSPIAWFDLADCLERDRTVLRDRSSPSGWRFRSDHHAELAAFERAFQLVPSWGFFRPFQRLSRLLQVEAVVGIRTGTAEPPDTTTFWAVPGVEQDSVVVMVPYPAKTAHLGHNSSGVVRAIDLNRQRLLNVVTLWARAFPDSAQPLIQLSRALEVNDQLDGSLQVERSALTATRRARRLARGAMDSLTAARAEVRVLVKLGRFGEARDVASNTLRSVTDPEPAEAELVAGLAALTGQATRAASLATRAAGPRNPSRLRRMPLAIVEAWEAFLAYAAIGAPTDSVFATAARLDTTIATRADPAQRRPLRCDTGFRFTNALAYPVLRRARDPRECPEALEQEELAWRLSQGDHAGVAAVLRHLADQRAASMVRPGDVSIETVFLESWIAAQAGDTTTAVAGLDLSLSVLPGMRTDLVGTPRFVGGLVRAMALRAELAARKGERAAARRWASAVADLWRDADPELRTVVDLMNEIIRGAPPR